MKETLAILEEESKQVFHLFQEKETNEETYQKVIEDMEKEMNRIKTNLFEIHSKEPSPIRSVLSLPKKSEMSFVKEDRD